MKIYDDHDRPIKLRLRGNRLEVKYVSGHNLWETAAFISGGDGFNINITFRRKHVSTLSMLPVGTPSDVIWPPPSTKKGRGKR